MRNLTTAAVIALLVTSVFATGATAADASREGESFEYCGDIKPVFKNPDLQPQDDGLVHASGWFFIQFQVIQSSDVEVDRLAFSFGKPIPDGARTCDTPEWITDAYYKDYRVDDDPSDGFFIPINTTNVPDGEYAAAVTVYAGGEEVGRMFTRAVVENGCPLGWRGSDCDAATVQENDQVKPWPIVLPGDGAQVNGVNGLTIEFAEQVREVSAEIAPAPGQPAQEIDLEEMQPRTWDDDSVFSTADEDAPSCPACAETTWGPAYKWEGEIGEDAVVTVRATDQAGNEATKIMHISSTSAGGVIDVQLPEVEVTIREGRQTAAPGEEVEYEVVFQNVGQDVAHVNLHVNGSDDVETAWDPNHVMIESGEEAVSILKASSTTSGEHKIQAHASYKSGADDVREDIPLVLEIDGDAEAPSNATSDEGIETTETGDGDDEQADAPFAGPAIILGLVALAALVVRRR